MRIAIVHPFLDKPRGAELQLGHLARVLLDKGHEVDIYTFAYDPRRFQYSEFLDGARVRKSPVPHWRHPSQAFDLPNVIALSKYLEGYDLVNPHNHPAEWVSGFTSAPCVWICNEPPYWEYQAANLSIPARVTAAIDGRIHRRLTDGLTRILAIDPNIQASLQESGYRQDIEVVWSGAELLHPVVHRENGVIDVLCVGPLHPQKRPLDVLEVFRRISQRVPAVLRMVGKDMMRGRVQETARKQGLAVEFIGEVSTAELYALYALTDVALFLPQSQPWGIFPLEAILAGIPTVVSDSCGFLKKLRDGEVPAVPTGDLDGVTEKVMEITTNPEAWRQRTAAVAARWKTDLSWDAYGERVERNFTEVLESRG